MKNIAKKVGVIGNGQVGSSFLYAATNQGLASKYVLIDINKKTSEGHAIDTQDTQAILPTPFTSVVSGTYKDIADADLLVISAGRPQKPGEPRANLINDNAPTIYQIAKDVKASGFKGISLVAANPMDVITLIYQETTGFDPHKVVGSGTTLDSSRLRRIVGAKLGVNAPSVEAYLMGQHGDGPVAIWSHATVMDQPMSELISQGKLKQSDLDEMYKATTAVDYQVMDLIGATYFGIGDCLARLSKAILNDEKCTIMLSAKVNGEYGQKGIYMGVPARLDQNGWSDIVEWDLTPKEKAELEKSAGEIKKTVKRGWEIIKAVKN